MVAIKAEAQEFWEQPPNLDSELGGNRRLSPDLLIEILELR
jgi:hypothetical protein